MQIEEFSGRVGGAARKRLPDSIDHRAMIGLGARNRSDQLQRLLAAVTTMNTVLATRGTKGIQPALEVIGLASGADQVYVDQYNVCSDHLPNCAASFPYHDSAATVAYGCGKCLGNAVPVISAVNKQIVVAYTDPAT